MRIASSSSLNGITAATGPKISSRAARSPGDTGDSTVGGNQNPGPLGALLRRPTSVAPVNAILYTSGCSTSRSPTVRPAPTTTLSTPSGMPADSASSSSSSAVMGVKPAGFSTTVLPAASAGPTFQEAMAIGKFQGTISPTTPSGSRNVMSTPPATGMVLPSSRSGAPA